MNRLIITLSGSTKFEKQFREVARDLSLKGAIILMPGVFSQSNNIVLTEKQIKQLYSLHLHKIRMSDIVYVIDVDGYIGNSTKKEIAYAKRQKKQIFYYSNIKEVAYK